MDQILAGPGVGMQWLGRVKNVFPPHEMSYKVQAQAFSPQWAETKAMIPSSAEARTVDQPLTEYVLHPLK